MPSYSSLFDLGNIFLIDVLSIWIDIVELVYFDSTCCSKMNRSRLFHLIHDIQFNSCGTTLILPDEYYDWLMLREIRVKKLVLSNYNEKRLYPAVDSVLNYSNQTNAIESIEMRHCINLESIVAKCAKSIVSLNLFCSIEMSDAELLELTKDTINLKEISLSACEALTSDGMDSFLRLHPGLEALDMSMYTSTSEVIDKICRAVGEHCPHMKKLHCPEGVTGKGLRHIAMGCPLLEILHVDDCASLHDEDICLIAESCPRLRKLYASKVGQLKESSLARLSKCCPLLSVLDAEASPGVTDSGMGPVLKACRGLRMLIMYDCIRLSTVFLHGVAAHCPLLTHLYLTGAVKVDDKCLMNLSRRCGLLQALYINGSKKVTDKALVALLTHCPLLSCLNTSGTQITAGPLVSSSLVRDLVHLELDASGTDYLELPTHAQRPFDLNNEDVDYTVKYIPHTSRSRVRSLVYANEEAIFTSKHIASVLAQSATSLRTVKFDRYSMLTDDVIHQLVVICPQLVSVSIVKCAGLTRAALLDIASHCTQLASLEVREQVILDQDICDVLDICGPRLTHLSVQGCLQLTDQTLTAVSSHCAALTSFDMSECFLMTDRGLKHVLRRCVGLQRLALHHCEDHITEDTLYEICQVSTALRTLDIRYCSNIELPVLCIMRLMLECPTLKSVLYYEEVQVER